MADGSLAGVGSLKGKVSEEEWKIRVDLAALYRLVARERWDDLIFTHISARIPGGEHQFLINPYGYFFEEITASSLVRVDLDGNILQDTPYFINPAGFVIHSAIHAAREDALFVMHLHTNQGVAVSAQKEGLLPLSQHALGTLPFLAYHDYEGIALDFEERQRLVADLGDKTMMILRNHGTLTLGKSAAATWNAMWGLERACYEQCMALAGGRETVLIAPEEAQATVARQVGRNKKSGNMGATGGQPDGMMSALSSLIWPACLRRLDRELPGYDA